MLKLQLEGKLTEYIEMAVASAVAETQINNFTCKVSCVVTNGFALVVDIETDIE